MIMDWFAGRTSKTKANRLNDSTVFILRAQLTNVAAGRVIQPGESQADRRLRTHVLNYAATWNVVSFRIPYNFVHGNIKESFLPELCEELVTWHCVWGVGKAWRDSSFVFSQKFTRIKKRGRFVFMVDKLT